MIPDLLLCSSNQLRPKAQRHRTIVCLLASGDYRVYPRRMKKDREPGERPGTQQEDVSEWYLMGWWVG